MRARPLLAIALVVFTGTALPSPISAQEEEGEAAEEGGFLDVGGGVMVPVPRGTRTAPDAIEPETDLRGGDRPGVDTVRGRERGRVEVDEEGREVRVYQSSGITSIERSSASRDRFDWFYSAEDVYFGIIPRVRDSLPHISRYQARGSESARPNEVTWIGFQAFPDSTRVFVQFARFPTYTVEEHEDGAVLVLVVENTRLSLSNHRRFLDTRHFNRSVARVSAETLPGGRARLVIQRDELAPYSVSVDGSYVYIDFQDARTGRPTP